MPKTILGILAMPRLLALVVLAFVTLTVAGAQAQSNSSSSSPPTTANAAAAGQPPTGTGASSLPAAVTPPPPATSLPPATVSIPDKMSVEVKSSGGSGIGVWIAVLVALVAAGGSIAASRTSASISATAQTTVAAIQAEYQAARMRHDKEEANRGRKHDNQIEDRRLKQAQEQLRRTTDLSEREIEQTAWKIVHDQKIEEAKLLHLYFDKLVSSNDREQELALYAISAFVDASVIERIAAGGRLVSRGNLSKLAASGDSEAAEVAQTVLNRGWEEVGKSILVIEFGPQGQTASSRGFYVSDRIVIALAIAKPGDHVRISRSGQTRPTEATCIAVQPELFLMLIEVPPDAQGKPLMLASQPPTLDKQALTLVAKVDEDKLLVRTGNLTALELEGLHIQVPQGQIETKPLFETDIIADPTTGGAPFLDSEGRVTGILVAAAFRESGIMISFGAPIHSLLPLIREHEQAISAKP